jgi:hypothetical protein
MIQYNNVSDFQCDSDEGKILLAAIAILTSIDKEDIDEKKWGGFVSPDKAVKQVVELANKIFYEEEWKLEEERLQKVELRDEKIKNLLK